MMLHTTIRSLVPLALVLLLAAAAQAAPKDKSDQASGKKPAAKASEWFLQTLLLAEKNGQMTTDDRSGVIGRISGASETRDLHDIPAYVNVNGSSGAIVFPKGEEWGDDAGQYLSDYRAPGVNKQTWTFAVTSEAGASVTLYWDGLNEIAAKPEGGYEWHLNNANTVLKTLRLVDLATGVVIPAAGKKGAMGSYSFVMDASKERMFRWVQGEVSPEDTTLTGAVSLTHFGPLEPAARMQSMSAAASAGGFPPPPSLDNATAPSRTAPPVSVEVREQ